MSEVFVSYSHRNEAIFERLMVHLKPLVRQGKVDVFADTEIEHDENWREKIRKELADCKVAILLVSADFLASNFIVEEELPSLFAGRETQTKKLLTLFVGPCNIQPFPLISNFQAFNSPDKPISSLSDNQSEKVLSELAQAVQESLPEKTAGKEEVERNSNFWESLPELDYSNALDRRLFSGFRVDVPKLIAAHGNPQLKGYSFENCWLRGPAVLFAPTTHAEFVTFDVAGNDINSLMLKPCSNGMLGVVDMSHLTLVNSRVSDISFIWSESLEALLTKMSVT